MPQLQNDTMLSSDDVLKLAGAHTLLITYDEFSNIEDINDMFKNKVSALIILYRKTKTVGHWVGLIKHNKHLIEYYDSYGNEIDTPLKWFKDNKNELGQESPRLSELLLRYLNKDTRNRIMYNEYKYQGLKDKTSSTCGRYVGLRLRHRKTPLCKYQEYFNSIKKDIDPDKFIIEETQKYL